MSRILEKLKGVFARFERIGLPKLDRSKWPLIEPRVIVLTNLVVTIAVGISFAQAIVELAQGAYLYATADFIGGALMLAATGMNALGWFRASRIWLLLMLNVDVYYFNIISGFSTGLELLYFLFVLFPFFLFSTREFLPLLVTSLVPFGLFCISRFYPSPLFVPASHVEAAPAWYAIAVPIVAFGTTFLFIYRFLRLNEEMQAQLVHHSKFASLGEFAAGISHEINNPLNVINLNAQLARRELAKHPGLEPLDAKLDAIERSTMRAAGIIGGLKLFSREAGTDPHADLALNECIRDTIALCEQRFRVGRIRFDVELAGEPVVHGNATQISQVLINILNNAYDATQQVDERWIALTTSVEGGRVRIRIADSGPGIARRIRAKIMEPFFTTKPVGKGTGLGLSISKGIVEAHRGELTFEPQERHTTFVVQLPLVVTR